MKEWVLGQGRIGGGSAASGAPAALAMDRLGWPFGYPATRTHIYLHVAGRRQRYAKWLLQQVMPGLTVGTAGLQAFSPVKDGFKGQQLAMGEEAATAAATAAVSLHVTAGPQLGTPKSAGARPTQDRAGRGGGAIRLLLGAAVVAVTVVAAAAMGGGMQAREGKDKAVTGRKKQQEVN